MSSSIKCLTTVRLLCRGGSSDSEESDDVLGGRFCFLGLLLGGEGCLTGGLGLLTEPLGRPRGRFMGASGTLAIAGGLGCDNAACSQLTAVTLSSKGALVPSALKSVSNGSSTTLII